MSQISLELITQRALELLDEVSIEQFSMRRLGKALDVDAKAVYYYFPNKESLLDAVLERAFAHLALPEDTNQPWQENLRHVARTYYDFLSQHPNLIALLMRRDGSVSAVLHLVEQIVRSLRTTPLSPKSKVLIVDLFWSFLPGIARDAAADSAAYTFSARIQAAVSGQQPALQALFAHLESSDMEDDLDLQINLLIWGIEELIRRGG